MLDFRDFSVQSINNLNQITVMVRVSGIFKVGQVSSDIAKAKNGQVSSYLATAKNGQVSSDLVKTVNLGAILLQQ